MKKALDDSVTWGSFTVGLPLLTATNTLSFQDDRFLLSSVKLRPHQRQCRQKATLSPKSATLSPKKGDIVAGVDGALVMVDFSQSLTLSQGRGCDRHQLLNWLCRACATIHDRRPRLYCRRAARMEQSTCLTAPTVIIATIEETFENSFI